MTTAVAALQPSKLNPPENQLMKTNLEIDSDTALDTLVFFISGKKHQAEQVRDVIVDGSVERTMAGASTVSITLLDADRSIQTSGILTKATDINIDGLYFRLQKVERQGDTLDVIFEDREVALLRLQSAFRKANRATSTRAQFAESLVREQRLEKIRFFSPEEKIVQPIAPDLTQSANASRSPGFVPGADITVKGVNATPAQLNNLAIVISVGQAMGAGELAVLAAVEAVTVESSAMNLAGGDRDSVGIFQQRNIPPWNKRNRRDVAQASTTFYEQAMAYEKVARIHGQTSLSAAQLAQAVQMSAYPDRYAQYAQESQHTLDVYDGGGQGAATGIPNPYLDNSQGQGSYEFTRGTIDQYGRVTKETTWDCLQRLAQEVNWVCFMVNGTVYFISEDYLFRSRPRMIIDADEKGIDQIDFDFDKNKKNSTVTVTCHIDRWGAPPGSVIIIKDHGLIDGRWLVNDISRSLFDNIGTIQLIKPLPVLPEPPNATSTTPDSLLVGPTSSQRQAIVQAAQKVLAHAGQYTYRQYRPMASSIFDQFAKNHTDCSAFVTLCYKAGGAPDPNGLNYNGQGFTGTLWNNGSLIQEAIAQPGDLVFYGSRPPGGVRAGGRIATRHVALYIGNGETIEFGSTHPNQGTVHEASDFLGIRSYMA
jgi:cell wall-associated NlpC family hydrolase